ELVSSSQSRLVIDTSASDGDKLTFQQSRSTGNGQVEWGTYDSQRNWVPNGAIRYTVANQNLVRQILSGSGAITFEEIIVQGVSSGAERGFTASRVGSLVQLTVRSRQSTTDGSNITRDWEMAMRLGAS
ncbi:MAG TPA: hypothetical protein VK116_10250, partial [Planctomycetota bacterium]|nr:hypothetical protein [Planctomycetota bacterium]